MDSEETLDTTLGDLIVALTEATTPFFRDPKKAYPVVAFVLMHLLYNSGTTSKAWPIWH